MALRLREPAFARVVAAEVEVKQSHEMRRIGVLVVELDGLESVLEGVTRLTSTKPEVAGDVVLAFALPARILRLRSVRAAGTARARHGEEKRQGARELRASPASAHRAT
jgi:hypothetical protein